ncbi:hypothetical protein [uncultured Senegalimassilia sp.]|uniref:hypothetical protein n=1 Tax=uncultured Senegalimassilia sp. TaxID=1714350 RepID=UPI0025EB0920|nr:hypothetical protein [uncultured Senegalimassilia sp.]
MNLEEAIGLAEQGDLEVMQMLGSYYYDQNEYNEARNWYCKAAVNGRIEAMVPAALLTSMVSRAARKVSGGDAIRDQDVYNLNDALQWIRCAKEHGVDCNAESGVVRERALCAYEASKKEGAAITSSQAIAYLKEASSTTDKTPEVDIYLALALYEADQLSADDASLCFNLLKRCTRYTEDDEHDVKLGILDASLGFCYLKGKGCTTDDNAAYECFVQAGQKGFDCSDILACFKKKMFGGYVFKR